MADDYTFSSKHWAVLKTLSMFSPDTLASMVGGLDSADRGYTQLLIPGFAEKDLKGIHDAYDAYHQIYGTLNKNPSAQDLDKLARINELNLVPANPNPNAATIIPNDFKPVLRQALEDPSMLTMIETHKNGLKNLMELKNDHAALVKLIIEKTGGGSLATIDKVKMEKILTAFDNQANYEELKKNLTPELDADLQKLAASSKVDPKDLLNVLSSHQDNIFNIAQNPLTEQLVQTSGDPNIIKGFGFITNMFAKQKSILGAVAAPNATPAPSAPATAQAAPAAPDPSKEPEAPQLNFIQKFEAMILGAICNMIASVMNKSGQGDSMFAKMATDIAKNPDQAIGSIGPMIGI